MRPWCIDNQFGLTAKCTALDGEFLVKISLLRLPANSIEQLHVFIVDGAVATSAILSQAGEKVGVYFPIMVGSTTRNPRSFLTITIDIVSKEFFLPKKT